MAGQKIRFQLARKTCSACGEQCLDTDPRCWACGRSHFGPSGAAPDPERTLSGAGEPPERTLTAALTPSLPRWWRALGAGLGAAVLVVGLASWAVARALAPPPPPPAVASPQSPAQPLPPPEPPPAPPPAEAEPPVVITPRAVTRVTPAPPAEPPPAEPPPASSPVTIYRPPAPPPPAPPPVTRVPPPAPVAAAPERPPPPPVTPTETTAVVHLHNRADRAVRVNFERGAEPETVLLAAGGRFPVELPSGAYQVRVTAAGAEEREARTTLGAGRSYTLEIETEESDGGEVALLLREPTIDGGGGG